MPGGKRTSFVRPGPIIWLPGGRLSAAVTIAQRRHGISVGRWPCSSGRRRPDGVNGMFMGAFNDVSSTEESVGQFLARPGILLEVPEVQRPYSWEQEQVNQLFDDLLQRFTAKRGYSLSRMCTMAMERSSRDATPAREQQEMDAHSFLEVNEILDGQQRLVTLTLLFVSIYIRLGEMGVSSRVMGEVRAMTCAEEIISPSDPVDTAECTRSRITLHNEFDADHLRWFVMVLPGLILENLNHDGDEETTGSQRTPTKKRLEENDGALFKKDGSRMEQSFVLLYNKILTDSRLDTPDKLWRFFRFVRDKTFIVREHIRSDNLSAAYEYFHRINARGMQLDYTDELKALILIETGYNRVTRRARAREWERLDSLLSHPTFSYHARSHGDETSALARKNFGLLFEYMYSIQLARLKAKGSLPVRMGLGRGRNRFDEAQLSSYYANRQLPGSPVEDRKAAAEFVTSLLPQYGRAFVEVVSCFGLLDHQNETGPSPGAGEGQDQETAGHIHLLQAQASLMAIHHTDAVFLERRAPFRRDRQNDKELSWVPSLIAYLFSRPRCRPQELAEFVTTLERVYAGTWMLNGRASCRFATAFWDSLCIVVKHPKDHASLIEEIKARFSNEMDAFPETLSSSLQHRQPSDREKARFFLLRAEVARRIQKHPNRARSFMIDAWSSRDFWDRVNIDRILFIRDPHVGETGWTKEEVAESSSRLGALVLMDADTESALMSGQDGSQEPPENFLTSQELFAATFTHEDFVTRQNMLLDDLRFAYGLNSE